MQFIPTPDPIRADDPFIVRILLDPTDPDGKYQFDFAMSKGKVHPSTFTHDLVQGVDFEPELITTKAGTLTLNVRGPITAKFTFTVEPPVSVGAPDSRVALVPADPPSSEDDLLWWFINQITNRLRFEEFDEFITPRMTGPKGPEWYGTEAYRKLQRQALKFVETATDPLEAVAAGRPTVTGELRKATAQAGVAQSYVSSQKLFQADAFNREALPPSVAAKLTRATGPVSFPLPNVPFVELIWAFWHEAGYLVQTFNRILARFQNRRLPGRDPLAQLELSPLLPLRNLLWGFLTDEVHRLTVRRRNAEYEYELGMPLIGRAVPPSSSLVHRRSDFLEAFHSLLNASHAFYKERDDKTIEADAFPLLSCLRETHLVLAHGAHNQFADMAFTARAEMLTMQWALALPEVKQFLGGPPMLPYDEPWMPPVDTLKTLEGMQDASITHYFELASCGERLVLSVRHGRWNESTRTRDDAANWALTFRDQIQRYVHAYRTVTGVDLTREVNATSPSLLIARRLQQRRWA